MKRSSLHQQLQQIPGNVHDVCKVTLHKDYESKNVTDLILKEKKDGLFVVILKDTNGGQSHAVGIDLQKQLIYDYMEDKSFVLNINNLSIWCGSDTEFHCIAMACELKKTYQRPKKVSKK